MSKIWEYGKYNKKQFEITTFNTEKKYNGRRNNNQSALF